MKNKNSRFSFLGVALFFLTVAATVTAAVMIYATVDHISDGNRAVIAAAMFLVVLFLSVLFTLFDVIRRRIMVEKPTEKILDATQKIADGDFSVRLKINHRVDRHDRYDLIMENINAMAEELGKTELLKTDFISNVSHELKTPLAVIQNYVMLLKNPKLDDETKDGYVETVFQTTQKLTELVTNILKLNKLENQSIAPQRERVNLTESLAEAVIAFEEPIERKNLSVNTDVDDVWAYAPQGYLELIWNNLIGNAVKFTDDGGAIDIALKKQDCKAVVTIADTGCGISPETGKHIFDKFYQGDTAHSTEGNGLGLALVKRVIDIVGGEITVESELGKGTTFTVKLNCEVE